MQNRVNIMCTWPLVFGVRQSVSARPLLAIDNCAIEINVCMPMCEITAVNLVRHDSLRRRYGVPRGVM